MTTTREHPFYVDGKGWMRAGSLSVGNAIVTRAGPSLKVASVVTRQTSEDYRVYNFEVEDNHNYFVGKTAGGILVHNGDCNAPTLIRDHYGKLQSILARRGQTLGQSGPVDDVAVRSLASDIDNIVSNSTEVWEAAYRGPTRQFHILGNKTVVTQLDGTFESIWVPTPAQLSHYRTGIRIK